MENITNEREKYIEKLEKQESFIGKILKMDSGTVLSNELKKHIKDLKSESEIILRKLKNNEFEIAIVGLEKAGKSTFANALMENDLLPTKDIRCTFTSTQIEYAGDDKDESALVTFYSADEFNRDFKDRLRTLGFPEYEKYSFDTIDEDRYLSIYDKEVSEEKKMLYGDSIHRDILAIIKNVNSLSSLLGRPDISFAADKIKSGELEDYIVNESKARAVKQVIIKSQQLSSMPNAIIFDVPGFNSPTEMHRIQTLERMKAADAIVVVANGSEPSITVEPLKILRESDDDGNPLSDKLFVFANKADCASDISANIDETYDEWIEKGFVLEKNKNRIVFGSALVHLQQLDLNSDSNKRAMINFEDIKDKMPDGDGIDRIRDLLTEYNKNERFEVLKRRINRLNSDIRKSFNDVCSDYNDSENSRYYSTEQVDMAAKMLDDIRKRVESALLDLKNEVKTDMPDKLPLSNKILKYISDKITVENYAISDELVDEMKKLSPYIGNHEDVGRIDSNIRLRKFDEMYDDFSKNVVNIADDQHVYYSNKIIDIIVNSTEVDKSSPYYDNICDLVKNEIASFRDDLKSDNGNKLYYQSLIERFSRYIYQVLITSQYSEERLGEFYDSIDNYYSLSVFYRKPGHENDLSYIDIAPKNQPLSMMLLFHHMFNNEDSLKDLLDRIKSITGIGEMPKDVMNLIENALNFTLKDSIIKEIVKNFKELQDKTKDFKISRLKQILSQIIERDTPCSVADKEGFIEYYKKYHSNIRNGQLYSIEDLRKDFNVDIQILQDVLQNAFVRAISMEKPFVAREVKSIDDIIIYTKGEEFRKFLINNFSKIRFKETQELDKQSRIREQNSMIISSIKQLMESNLSD